MKHIFSGSDGLATNSIKEEVYQHLKPEVLAACSVVEYYTENPEKGTIAQYLGCTVKDDTLEEKHYKGFANVINKAFEHGLICGGSLGEPCAIELKQQQLNDKPRWLMCHFIHSNLSRNEIMEKEVPNLLKQWFKEEGLMTSAPSYELIALPDRE